MGKTKVMDKVMLFKLNKDTIDKLDYLVNNLNGLYPSKSQVIRSAIHRLYNEKVRDQEYKKDIF